MTKENLIQNIQRLIDSVHNNPRGVLAQSKEFIRNYIGNDNHFSKTLDKINSLSNSDFLKYETLTILNGLKDYVENDLLRKISIEREIK